MSPSVEAWVEAEGDPNGRWPDLICPDFKGARRHHISSDTYLVGELGHNLEVERGRACWLLLKCDAPLTFQTYGSTFVF